MAEGAEIEEAREEAVGGGVHQIPISATTGPWSLVPTSR
jgi:hypothetical protein